MKYTEFEHSFRNFTLVSLDDIRMLDPAFDRRRLSEWQRKGYIKKIINGFYVASDRPLNDDDLITIGSRIYHPAYVSFETALSRYRLIPETVYGSTCVTTLKTNRFTTPLGVFSYRSVQPRLFFGFRIFPQGGRLAFMEKALLDYFYINTNIATPVDFESLRFNKAAFLEQNDKNRLSEYLGRFDQKRLSTRITSFTEWCNHD